MATRQYIGARYVPKFFENSATGDSTWAANTAYEPLTIVTWNGNSYTSKKAVPAGVGNPSANAEYWASTGMFNAQVETLREQMEDLATIVNGITDDISEKKFILIGDSYGAGWTPETGDAFSDGWPAKLPGFLGLKSGNYIINNKGGTGFASGTVDGGYISQLNTVNNDHPEFVPDYIVVAGGRNDVYSVADIVSGCHAFYSRAKTLYPNTHILVGMIGWDNNYSPQLNMSTALEGYIKGCAETGMIYMSNVEYTLHDPTLMSPTDGKHPVALGNTYIAEQIAMAIMCGGGDVQYTNKFTAPIVPESGITLGENSQYSVLYSISNGLTRYAGINPRIRFTTPRTIACNGASIVLGTIQLPTQTQRGTGIRVPMPFILGTSDGHYYTVSGQLMFYEGTIRVALLNTNAANNNYMSVENVTMIDTFAGGWSEAISSMP